MSASSVCPGCQARDATLAQLQQHVATLEQHIVTLEQRVQQLEARLNQNASNSSLPPSANPPQAQRPVVKKPTGRKPGAQPGHEPHVRLRLPPERVDQVITYRPTTCYHCQTDLPAEPQPTDPEPTWHQVAELPPLLAHLTEPQGHFRTCPDCGRLNHAPIPKAVRRYSSGPRLCATLAYLSGSQHVSQRGLAEVTQTLFGVPLSVGAINHAQQQTSQALAPAHAEALQAVRQAPSKNTDETGWKQAGQRRWLWVAATATVACFVLHARRGLAGLTALLGEAAVGIIGSDRWCAYNRLGVAQRQLCWAHLKRDFQAMADRDNEGSAIGRQLLAFTEDVFHWWHRVRDGTLARATLRTYIDQQRPWLRAVLEGGRGCGCAKTAAVCRDLVRLEPALWTFVRREGVEPTNNAAERALRPAVLWRKRSQGCHSEAGCRLVERLLTVVQTLRWQDRNVLTYLQQAIEAHRAGLPAPKLLSTE